MSFVITEPYQFIAGLDGEALDAGSIYYGQPNMDPIANPKAVYFDSALIIPAPQPLRTVNGYIVRNGTPTFLFADGNYSILVLDKRGRQVYYVPDFMLIGNQTAVTTAYNPVVANIAALRALDKLKSSNSFVNGYYAAGDGGGGHYYLDAADTTSADNGGTIIVATDGGRWKFKGTPTFKTFGAKGDYNGTTGTDDTARIQVAIDAGVIRVTSGRYKITSPLTMHYQMVLEGDDEYTTSIEQTTANPIFVNDILTVPDFARTNFSKITLRGGTYAHRYQLSGINVQSLGDWNHVRFENQTVRAIDCDQFFIGNNFYDCVFSYCTGAIQVGKFANLNNFVNTRFEGMSSDTIIFLDQGGSARGGEVNNFTGCRFEARKNTTDTGHTVAILQSCTQTVFDGCYFEDTWKTILSETGATPYNTTAFKNCKFSGQELSVAPAGPKPELFISNGIVNFENNYFEFGTDGSSTAQPYVIGSNPGLNTAFSKIYFGPRTTDSGKAITAPWTPVSGIATNLLSITRSDTTNSPLNRSMVGGNIRVEVTGYDSGNVPVVMNYTFPFAVKIFANSTLSAVIGTPLKAEDNGPGATLSIASVGATSTNIVLAAVYTLATFGGARMRAEIDWDIAFEATAERPIVGTLQ